jgi:nucleoside-diphosphate-sugar epimerase
VHSASSKIILAPYGFDDVVLGSVGDSQSWEGVGTFDVVIHCASSSRGGETAYEEVFFRGMGLINQRQPQARKIFVSSTSVYGQTGGEIVTEDSPTLPASGTSKILVEAERVAREGSAIVVRSAGIYGPGRAVLFEKLRRGEAVIEGDGTRWLNQIHRDDLVAALAHLIGHGAPGEIYNACDDTPVTLRDYYAWCAEFLGVPLPPEGPINPQRKRGLTSKRVSNAKLRAMGWAPTYPSFREGLRADHSPK